MLPAEGSVRGETDMSIYEAIFNRQSVRKFRMEPLDAEILVQLRKFIANITPLDGESRLELEIHEHWNRREKIRGLWSVEAPYYLLVYCKEEQGACRNAGYVAEQAVLYLTSKEVGSCYLGETKVGAAQRDGLKRILVIGFGKPGEKLYRDSEGARRLPLSSLCVYKDEPGENLKKILKGARLAPSSFNSQPWRFVVYTDRLCVFARKDMLPRMKTLAVMRDFNMGIMLSHIMLGAEEFWMNMETVVEEQFLKKAYKNGEYICTIVFHS